MVDRNGMQSISRLGDLSSASRAPEGLIPADSVFVDSMSAGWTRREAVGRRRRGFVK
jgi:hypothetical protein